MNPSYPPTDSHIPSLDHKRLLSSTWHVLDQVCVLPLPRSHLILILPQPPPPSLREILGAYKSKGDGDRDMLIAMLNAKSAEDQVRPFLPLNTLPRPHVRTAHGCHSFPPQDSPRLVHHRCQHFPYSSSSSPISPIITSHHYFKRQTSYRRAVPWI